MAARAAEAAAKRKLQEDVEKVLKLRINCAVLLYICVCINRLLCCVEGYVKGRGLHVCDAYYLFLTHYQTIHTSSLLSFRASATPRG